MSIKLFLQRLGLGTHTGAASARKGPVAREREQFEADVKAQFQKLKEKGLSIPVFTL